MNIELFEKVKQHILEEPKRLDMGLGLLKNASKFVSKGRAPACNTIGCIAGWSVMLSGVQDLLVPNASFTNSSRYSWESVSQLAAIELDVPLALLETELFHVSDWDDDLRHLYHYSTFSENEIITKQAEITVMAIDRFIKRYNHLTRNSKDWNKKRI